MGRTEYKVLEDQVKYYESKGWIRMGCVDAFEGMHVHTISITKEIDDTEEITQPPA